MAALSHGFDRLGLKEIVSYAVAENWPSRRVMERIGMTYIPSEDFDYAKRNLDDPHLSHVVYRRSRNER
jgi:RimJ/RimL family protein N-acetyltransferase